MNSLETLPQAEAVAGLLRINLAGDLGAALPSNADLTLIEARQDSGVAACELVSTLIREAHRDIAARFAEHVASAPVEKAAQVQTCRHHAAREDSVRVSQW